MKLSLRLETIAAFVPKCSCVADVGTDHGYLPIYLVQQGTAESAIAMDVRKGPLKRAAAHIEGQGLSGRIQTRLGDGLEKLSPGEAQVVVIAGMGGELMQRIMLDGKRLWDQVRRWVLSPQSDWEGVRVFLSEHKFSILQETMMKEDGKYYVVLEVCRRPLNDETAAAVTGNPFTISQYRYGPLLIAQNHPVLREYLELERNRLDTLEEHLKKQNGEKAAGRLVQVREELHLIEEAKYEMQKNHTAAGGPGANGLCL